MVIYFKNRQPGQAVLIVHKPYLHSSLHAPMSGCAPLGRRRDARKEAAKEKPKGKGRGRGRGRGRGKGLAGDEETHPSSAGSVVPPADGEESKPKGRGKGKGKTASQKKPKTPKTPKSPKKPRSPKKTRATKRKDSTSSTHVGLVLKFVHNSAIAGTVG